MKRNTLNPYAPIEKVPLYTADQMRSRGYSVRLNDDDADDGWREVGLVSEEYLLVPNADVRDMAYEIADRSALCFEETRTFFDGKRYALALVAQSERALVEVSVGDYVSLGLLFENSYDGSQRLAASLFAYRLACSNGMLAGDLFTRVRFRHSKSSYLWNEDVARSMAMLAGARDGLLRFASGGKRLMRHPLGTPELAALRTRYLDRLPVTLWGKTMDRYLHEEEPTAWGLLNAGTNVLWHNERTTRADFDHNAYLTSNLLRYADEALSVPETPASSNASPAVMRTVRGLLTANGGTGSDSERLDASLDTEESDELSSAPFTPPQPVTVSSFDGLLEREMRKAREGAE